MSVSDYTKKKKKTLFFQVSICDLWEQMNLFLFEFIIIDES